MVIPSIAGSKWYLGNKVSKQEQQQEQQQEPGEKGPSQQAGNSNIGHLYLYEKTPDPELTRDDPWLIEEGGMWGKMKYNLSGPTFDFVFNGHNLPIGQEYTLIYYPDPWPAKGLICLGSGIVTGCEEACIDEKSGGGNIHIKESVDTGSFPFNWDENYGDENYPEGAKIFLVPSGDVDCDYPRMIGWTEDANLYEGALITFDATDD